MYVSNQSELYCHLQQRLLQQFLNILWNKDHIQSNLEVVHALLSDRTWALLSQRSLLNSVKFSNQS